MPTYNSTGKSAVTVVKTTNLTGAGGGGGGAIPTSGQLWPR